MLIRKANDSDCKAIFDWRNNPSNQKMFFNNVYVSYEEHVEWFKQSLKNSSRILYVGEINEERVGVCRFDYSKENLSAEVSINMNPNFRDKGIGKLFLINAIDSYESGNETILTARIKIENEASKKIFEYAGFSAYSTDEKAIKVQRRLSQITFKEVTSNDVDVLYELLTKREDPISHNSMPTYAKHKKFVLSQPYESWFLINDHDFPIGSFYIKNDNSVGINISSPTESIVRNLVNFLENSFSPKAAIPSKVPSYFFINVAKSNNRLTTILEKMGHIPIQVSYKLITKRS